jgi:hypothetical protein
VFSDFFLQGEAGMIGTQNQFFHVNLATFCETCCATDGNRLGKPETPLV